MRRKFVFVLFLLLCLPLLAQAQDENSPEATAEAAGVIAYGQPVDGTLTQAAPTATYGFSGSAGDVVTITATSDDFDTFLTLRAAGGTEVATDDDRAGNLNARIEALALPADGDYSITVSSYNNASTGAFTLTLEKIHSVEGASVELAVPTPAASPTAAAVTVEATAEPASNTLAIGDSVNGALTNDAPAVEYDFEGRAGQTITITLASTEFDAYLLLKDAGGDRLAADDDGAGGTDARISAFSLPADGRYTIIAGSYTNAETGAFTLTLDAASVRQTPVPTEAAFTPTIPVTEAPVLTAEPTEQAGNALTLGQTITGELDGDTPAAFTFAGRAGQLVTVRLASEDFDAYLRLLNEAGAELAADDDSGGSLNAQIALFSLPANGTYTLSAESFSGEGGAFTLTIQEVTPVVIEYTQTVRGRLTADEPSTVYRFTGQAGDVVAISAESGDFDTYLTLSQPDAGALAEDDDSGGNLNSLIGPYTLPTTGDYYVSVRAIDSSTGAFTLSLLKATLTPIAYGDTLVGEFTPQTPALYYQFEAVAGDVIHIRVNSGGTLDTSLTLRGPDGYEVAFDDDSGEGNDPEINRLVLAQGGTYMVLIKPYDREQTGRINLTLAREVLASLDAGKQRVQLNEKQTQDVLTFSGTAGERVWLEVRLLDNTSSAPAITISQGGEILATANATAVAALTLELIIPADGAVNVQVSDANFARVTLELTLERLGE